MITFLSFPIKMSASLEFDSAMIEIIEMDNIVERSLLYISMLCSIYNSI